MVYDQTHRYLTWGGTLPGAEIWQTGIHIAGVDAPLAYGSEDDVEENFDNLPSIISGLHTRSQTAISVRCELTWAKIAVIKPDGKYKYAPAIYEWTGPDVVGGSASSSVHPNQICIVASLRSQSAFGQAQRGRCYLPMPAIPVEADGRISPVEANEVATSFATFVDEVNAEVGGGLTSEQVTIMSSLGSGAHQRVHEIRVGTVLDTQRRRRNQLTEEYSVKVMD